MFDLFELRAPVATSLAAMQNVFTIVHALEPVDEVAIKGRRIDKERVEAVPLHRDETVPTLVEQAAQTGDRYSVVIPALVFTVAVEVLLVFEGHTAVWTEDG